MLMTEGRLLVEDTVVVLPDPPLGPRAARSLVRGPRARMDRGGAVLEDEADPTAGVLQQQLQRPLEPTAEGSLIVGELDDRDRRVGRTLHHGRRDGQRDLRRRAHRPGADEPEPREDAYPTVVHSPRAAGPARHGRHAARIRPPGGPTPGPLSRGL